MGKVKTQAHTPLPESQGRTQGGGGLRVLQPPPPFGICNRSNPPPLGFPKTPKILCIFKQILQKISGDKSPDSVFNLFSPILRRFWQLFGNF